jgi:plastocyanin
MVFGVALAGCGKEKPATTAANSAPVSPDEVHGGTIAGTVAFTGTKPAEHAIDMSANPQCERTHRGHPVITEDVVVNANGTLRNVFVWVKAGLPDVRWDVPAVAVTIDQQSCMYRPRVAGAMVGQSIRISNSDPLNHNVYALPEINAGWNGMQSPGAAPEMHSFAKQEVMVPLKCNVHPWMRCFIGVVGHPFFGVTGGDGSFTIKGLRPGIYTIQAWHEKYGTQERQVTVGAGESKTVEFSYKG